MSRFIHDWYKAVIAQPCKQLEVHGENVVASGRLEMMPYILAPGFSFPIAIYYRSLIRVRLIPVAVAVGWGEPNAGQRLPAQSEWAGPRHRYGGLIQFTSGPSDCSGSRFRTRFRFSSAAS